MTAEEPLPSGFCPTTTADEVIGELRLDGKLAIVTGGYAGIGLETVRVLEHAGARVIVPARDLAKARAALAGSRATILEMDLAEPATIDAFAAQIREPVHLLISNAGIMAVPLARDTRGLESQLAVNHVGHFQLFVRLVDRLVEARGARVIALSSHGHVRSAFDFEDPSFFRRPARARSAA
jgi:NAD(P)-dependent dehydrogenase (short-subunit alcohol dehydrogenase family)